MLEIPQASVFNGKPAQEKAPDTVQRRRKAHAVQSILAAHRDSLRPARMEQETEGTWEQEENVVTVTYNGLVSKFQKDGNKLILDQNGIVFTITKK